MRDTDCVDFLQWALPHLQMRWRGFRRVRGQVCKQIGRRCQLLGLPDVASYQQYLETHPAEWLVLDRLCRISISRFYRDRAVFDQLRQVVLPTLAKAVLGRGERELHCWSIGCASGEEPYTLSLMWQFDLQPKFPALICRITATDADEQLLQRAQAACYPASSLRDLPQEWRITAFVHAGRTYRLGHEFRAGVEFQCQDIRLVQPAGSFHLVLCRNLVFTYFTNALQRQVSNQIIPKLHPGGILVIGQKESLPDSIPTLTPWFARLGIYRTGPTGTTLPSSK